MTITKNKISLMLNSKLGFSNNLCEEIVNTVFSNILEIAKVQKLTLKNFGSFEVKQKKQRPGINFHTKSPVMIASKKNLRFSPSEKLKALINKSMR
ncbi:HU family DNA-binding protein [Rickettsia typhi]|uniref:Histone-like DNA-binding protein n=2 Tax=Rickettsia typhi TaxID=785 RepID=HLP_RICTY|nr:HU family DNA-binding protein [Rickettsia typhi]Q9AKA7.1 RecName: Full=Histone-like DNA-binding protein [Rickettsia typhi str. Wilmington]AAU04162.1 integration host factor alpha subunit [Rickettsia typhi str. Wilmington]AFE54539.1 integration host factor alpha subunit [Rickettsia typhi str. TH1527]AFE55378.1 integration host factor alpha subunit [Rickettsia typhi str. B9991CWPP]CAC33761.1 Integration host factor alpha-subunit [Rickettsia typhi str. Wilmington]